MVVVMFSMMCWAACAISCCSSAERLTISELACSVLDADVSADSLNLEALDITVAGVSRVKGSLVGRVSVAGTVDRPVATGRMTLDDFSFYSSQLGIAPDQGRALIRAAQEAVLFAQSGSRNR